ncbi:MAG TPA: GNAT family protein [Gemmatimonadales bacterium]|nr:GNAT family protein [Gemmatimonadales bacterium]
MSRTPVATTSRLEPCVLEGRLVRLEPMRPSHLDQLCSAGLDPELWRLTVSRIATPDDMRRYIDAALAEQQAGTALPFVTIWRTTGQVIGSTRFGNAALAHRRVEIGWTWLARPWQRSGANPDAKYLMLRHAFETLGMVRVELKTSTLNQQSRGAMKKLGAVEEGVLRRHMINEDGSPRDSVFFSILADEWPAVKAGLEDRLRGR